MLHGFSLDLKTRHSSMQNDPGNPDTTPEQRIPQSSSDRPSGTRHLHTPRKSGEQGLIRFDRIGWSVAVMDRLTYPHHQYASWLSEPDEPQSWNPWITHQKLGT